MELLLFALLVLVIVGVLCFIVERAPVLSPTFKWAIEAVLVIIGLVLIVQRSGIA